jgi:hypothetical protein
MLEADIGEDKNNLSVIKRDLGLFFCGISLRAYVNHLRNPRENLIQMIQKYNNYL